MKRDPRLVRLSREHTQALMLAQRIERTPPDAPDADLSSLYSTVLAFWSGGLLTHFTAETDCLLARLLHHVAEDDERAVRLQRDHLDIETLVGTVRDGAGAAARREALAAFATRLRDHVRWEEETLFPATESLLAPDELDGLGADLAARLPEQPPSVDNTRPVEVVRAHVVGPRGFLLGKRARDGTWSTFGGKVDGDEEPGDALRRELREELDIDVLDYHRLADRDRKWDGTPARIAIYAVTRWSGKPRNAAPREHSEIAWFTRDELQKLAMHEQARLEALRLEWPATAAVERAAPP